MKNIAIAALMLAVMPCAGTAEEDLSWPGPEWPQATCPILDESVIVSIQGFGVYDESLGQWRKSKSVTTRAYNTRKENSYHVRWMPGAEVEVLCGKSFIIIAHLGDTMIEIVSPK